MKNTLLILSFVCLLIYNCKPKQNENLGSNITDDPQHIQEGKEIFELHCSSCHHFGQPGIGPDLSGLTRVVDAGWIKNFIQNPAQMINGKDARAQALFEQFKVYMPNFSQLKANELEALLSYLHTFEKQKDPLKIQGIKNPIKDTIGLSEIVANLEFVAQVPASNKKAPLARINKIECEPASGRLFVNDLRGKLYELKNGGVEEYLDVKSFYGHFIDEPGLGTGFGSFAFHPDFENNGLLYTTHTETPGHTAADFSYDPSIEVKLQWVLIAWKTTSPRSEHFSGSGRELLRINFVSRLHGMQEIAFNPNATKESPDYGNLYIGIGDGGSVLNKYPQIAHHQGTGVWSSILRIDPLGSNSANKQYGIPANNPFVGDPNKKAALWAYGFRNPNRLIWDAQGRMFATDIGETQIEEVNEIEPGKFYGWPIREGTFIVDPVGDLSQIYPLPENDSTYHVTYPLLQLDHDEIKAISGGFIGQAAPFKDRYVFGDIPTGRLFESRLDADGSSEVAAFTISFKNKNTDLYALTGNSRVDLRFGKDCNGNLYIFTKADGRIYKVAKQIKSN